jgi:transposase-like protein
MKYYDAMKGMSIKNKFDVRLKMVKMVEKRGISETARALETTRNTVRKWLVRYREEGLSRLKERSRAPKLIPHKLKRETEERIVALRKSLKSLGQDRLKEQFNFFSTKTINRVLKQNGLIAKRKKKW